FSSRMTLMPTPCACCPRDWDSAARPDARAPRPRLSWPVSGALTPCLLAYADWTVSRELALSLPCPFNARRREGFALRLGGSVRFEHRREQHLFSRPGWQSIQNVTQPSVQPQHGKAMHHRPDTCDVSSLRQRKTVCRNVLVTPGADDRSQFRERFFPFLVK